MDTIPILKMGDFLLLSIQVDMHDQLALELQDQLAARIVRESAKGVVIEISALEVVDSFIGRMVGNIASLSQMLGAQTIVVGMRPAVAIMMVELGVSLSNVRTALNAEKAVEALRSAGPGWENSGHDTQA